MHSDANRGFLLYLQANVSYLKFTLALLNI
jgi:hypothetical protein